MLLQIAGPVSILAGVVWSLFAHTKTATIAAAAAVPGTTVVTTPELANAVPAANAVSSATNAVVSR